MDNYSYSYKGNENYCYPGTEILINKLNIRDEEQLSKAERDITRLKLLKLYEAPVPSKFDFSLLRGIHKIIFEDMYSWAGQIRRGDFFSKGGSIFCRGSLVQLNADKIFGELSDEKYLCNLDKTKLASRMAYYMGEINALHPFREGNGRTLREFFRQLSMNAGYLLDFNNVDAEVLLMADINAFNGVYSDLELILNNVLSSLGSS